MIEKWFDALRTAKELGGSGSKKQCGGVCVVDRFREIALTSVVCKVSVNTGLRQGCVFLPLSFSLYINGL